MKNPVNTYSKTGANLVVCLLLCGGCGKQISAENRKAIQPQPDPPKSVEKQSMDLPAPPNVQEVVANSGGEPEMLAGQEMSYALAKEAQTDFRAALRRVSSFYSGVAARNHASAMLVRTLCLERLDDLASYLKQMDSGEARQEALGLVASDWAAKDSLKLVNYALLKLEGKDKNSAATCGLSALIKLQKFDDVSAFIESMPYSRDRSWAIHQLSSSYGRQNLPGAMSWADSLQLDEDRVEAYRQLLPYISEQSGAIGLTEIANRFQNDSLRRNCIEFAVKTLSKQDNMNDAANWVKNLSPKERAWAELQLVQTAADRDLSGWTKYVVDGISPEAQGKAIVAIAQKQFIKSPIGAANWAMSLPEKLQGNAIVTVTGEWYSTDSIGLSDWITTLPVGRSKDRALATLASSLASSDKSAALDVANQISDAGRKRAVLGDLNAR